MCSDFLRTARGRRRRVHKERRCLAERQRDYSVWIAKFPPKIKELLNVKLTSDGKDFWWVGWFSTINGTFSSMFEYLSKPRGGLSVFVLARREAGGSKRYKTLLVGLCVAQAKLPDTVSGICTRNTVK